MAESYLKFWTGLNAEAPDLLTAKDRPFPIRCYFDNDSDQLINFRGKNGQVDLDLYRQLLKSLKGMGYNAIDIHDQLGRREFYEWDNYKARWDYKADLNRIGHIIDMAHDMDMMIQIPMYCCWEFDHLEKEKEECWCRSADIWKGVWQRMLKETPLGKGDLFLFRPRSPLWDNPYRCECKACQKKGTGSIMTEAFASLEEIVLSHNPQAKLICDLYAQGVGLWESAEFKPSENWILTFPDNGYGRLMAPDLMIESTHQKGIYLHAGFWLNNVIQDPHHLSLVGSMEKADELAMTDYVLVNGQGFKDFILNLEMISMAADNPSGFNLSDFLYDWAGRLFGTAAADDIAELIALIGEAHQVGNVGPAYLDDTDVDRGYIVFLREAVYPSFHALSGKESTGVPEVPWLEAHFYAWERAMFRADSISDHLNNNARKAFDDQFGLPVRIFATTAELALTLRQSMEEKEAEAALPKADRLLQQLHKFCTEGSLLTDFKGWLLPENLRPFSMLPQALPPADSLKNALDAKPPQQPTSRSARWSIE